MRSIVDLYRKNRTIDIESERTTMCICQYTCLDKMGHEFNAMEIGLHISLRIWAYLKRRVLKGLKKVRTICMNPHHDQSEPSSANPRESMYADLMCGDVLEVLPYACIEQTLNSQGRCKGLSFMPNMKTFCGQRSTVLAKPRHILDQGGYKVQKSKDIIILNHFYCNGDDIVGCDRTCLYYWKDDWLTKVAEPVPRILHSR